MFRVTASRLGFSQESFHRMSQWAKRRDPNAKFHRTGYLFMEMIKRLHAYFLALTFVVLGTVYNQYYVPDSVNAPLHDGRSLVT